MSSDSNLAAGADRGFAGTVLVTGGAGFVGSALVRTLIRDTAAEVVTVDRLTYAGNRTSLGKAAESPRHRFIHADICDGETIAEVLAAHRPDLIIHLAAESHVDRSIAEPLDFVRTNVLGTTVLLSRAAEYLARVRETDPQRAAQFRFHHVSTDEVFGDRGEDPGAFNEESPYAPNSPYSASKAGADHLVRAWRRTYGLPIVISSCSNNYGPYQHQEKLIPKTILNALSGRSIPVYGDGRQSRDWIHVEDHVSALLAVASRGRDGASYLIGAGDEWTNLEVVEVICRQLDELRPLSKGSHRDLIAFVEDRPGHDTRYALDASRLRRELGWSPRRSLAEGLRSTVQWYLEHRGPWIEEAHGEKAARA